jgi:hypothetical protein
MTHFYGVSCDCSIVCFIDLRLLADNVAQLSARARLSPAIESLVAESAVQSEMDGWPE